MGGKRPDQYRIDPGEAGATDYKFRRKTGKEGDIQDRLYGEVMKGRTEKGQPVPSDSPDPESRRKREAQARRAHDDGEQEKDEQKKDKEKKDEEKSSSGGE